MEMMMMMIRRRRRRSSRTRGKEVVNLSGMIEFFCRWRVLSKPSSLFEAALTNPVVVVGFLLMEQSDNFGFTVFVERYTRR